MTTLPLGVDRVEDVDLVRAVGPEVAPDRDERRAAAQRECCRSCGKRGALAEELHLDAVAGEVAITEQAHHVVGTKSRAALRLPAVGDSGMTRIPSWRRVSTNQSKSSGGSSGSATTVIVYP